MNLVFVSLVAADPTRLERQSWTQHIGRKTETMNEDEDNEKSKSKKQWGDEKRPAISPLSPSFHDILETHVIQVK